MSAESSSAPQGREPDDVEALVKDFMCEVELYDASAIGVGRDDLIRGLSDGRDRINTELAITYAKDHCPEEALKPKELLGSFDKQSEGEECSVESSKRQSTLDLASFLYANDLISDVQKYDLKAEDIQEPISKKRRLLRSVLLDKYIILQGISFGALTGSVLSLANEQLNEGIAPIESPRNMALSAIGIGAAIATRKFRKKMNTDSQAMQDEILTETVLEVASIRNILGTANEIARIWKTQDINNT